MQVSSWANGQGFQAGQLQSTHPDPRLSHNTRSNYGFENNVSHFVHQKTGAESLVEHRIYNGVIKQVPAKPTSRHRSNNYLPLSNSLPTNSAHSLPNQAYAHVNLNTTYCPISQLASFSVTQPSTVPNTMVNYYSHETYQNAQPQTKNILLQMPNPTSSLSLQSIYIAQQPQPVNTLNQSAPQGQNCSQISQQRLPSYTEAVLQNCRNTYATSNESVSVATSCVNMAATNNQIEKNNYLVLQTNENHAAGIVNKHRLLTQMLATNVTSKSLTACVQTQTNSHQNKEHLQQPTARGNGEIQTVSNFPAKPAILKANTTAVPLQTTTSTSCFVNKQMSRLYQKIKESLNRNTCASTSQSHTVTVSQPNDGSIHTSPGHVLRAVAVIPPLAQERPSNRLVLPNSQLPPKPSSSPNQLETHSIVTSNTKCSAEMSHIYLEKAGNVQATSPSPNQVTESSINAKLSKRQRSSSTNRKTPTEQNPCEIELSFVPTTEWTLDKLYAMIQDMEKNDTQHEKKDNAENESANQIMHRFWVTYGKVRSMAWYKKLITEVNEFCSNVNPNAVILSHTKCDLSAKYYVLQHDEAYAEASYTSPWLNNNSQLDDIDKEFGFPWFLKYQVCGSSSNSTSLEIHSKPGDNSQTEIPSGHLVQDKAVCQDASNQSASKNQSDVHSEDDSSYSWKIEVLPPDEAKAIFEQTQCKSPQMVDTRDKPQESKKETCWKETSSIEMVCCMEKWKEKFGLSSESKCKCQDLDRVQLDDKDDSLSRTEDDCTPVFASKDKENIQGSNNTSIIVISESEEESQVSNPIDHDEDFLGLAESNPVANTDKNLQETKAVCNDIVFTNCEKLLPEEECRMEREETASETPQDKEETSNNGTSAPSTLVISDTFQKDGTKLQVASRDNLSPLNSRKLKLPSHLTSQTVFESFSKSKNTRSVKCVELLLFGSAVRASQSDLQSQDSLRIQQLPRKIIVKLSPSRRSSEEDSLGSNSVRKRIHKKKMRRKHEKFVILNPMKSNSPTKKVNSKRKMSDHGNSQSNKKKRFCCDGKTEKSGNEQVLKKPVNGEVQPLQENALKLPVLPSTFSSKEGSNNDSTNDATADEKTEAEDKQCFKNTKAWLEESSKKNPLRSASVSETKNIFQEFQKRYKMMNQTTMDE